jgi:aminoglycoside phosphotransferase (APT) family kinase protein
LKFDVSRQMPGGLKLSDQIVAPNTRDLEVLAKTLSAWLAKQMPAASTIRIDNLDYPRGAGMSHETILFDAHWHESGRDHTQGMVVRIKPQVFTVFPDNLFEEQYQLMKMLGDGNHVRVARVLWLEHDATILGNPFFVMEKKYGRVPVSYPPYATSGWLAAATPAQRRKVWEGAVRQLAAIQLVPISQARFLEGPAHAREGLAQEWDKYVRFVTWVQEAEPKPILQAALDRLQAQWPSNQPDGIVWGDARIGNMMFDDQFNVVAVMDWEQPSLGGALQDLAWFLTLSETMHGRYAMQGAWLEGMGTREETIALWEEICGKSAADIEWYEDFTQLKMACTGVRIGQLRGTQMMSDEMMAKRLKFG